jgi:hypothetical protein
VTEPVKDYTRSDSLKGPIDFHAPLIRMVDAVYPESDTARSFRDLVQNYIRSGDKDKAAAGLIRSSLKTWQDNDSGLHPLLEQSFLLHEVMPLSSNLSALAAAGLQALDYLDKSEPSPESWRTQQLMLVEQGKTPTADLLLMVVAPIQQLIEASGGPGRQQ